MSRTNHEKYMDAKGILAALSKIEANSETLTDDLHAIGPRCQWCQDRLTTWLIYNCYRMLKELTKNQNKE